ncbi:MAG: chemotaxis protein CheW [Desulfomonilaceae bacterium]|nr:chemotaxis protein CheW [Desulfomonilaceae bacterium]
MDNPESLELDVRVEADTGTDHSVNAGRRQPRGMHNGPSARSVKTVPEEEKRRILRERARRLARKRDAEEDKDEACLSVIGFRLGEERYAVEVGFVREVYALRDLTPVPCTPRHILGIVNVRGQVVSVTDMKVLFGLPGNGVRDDCRVLILSDEVMEMGILVDEVFGEMRIPMEKIRSQMPAPKSIKQEYLRGVAQDRLVVLDAAALLCDEQIVVHEEVGD